MSDPTMGVLYSALNGLMARQQVAANDIANLSTPGFHASQVDFEAALESAMAAGAAPPPDPAVVTPTNAPVNQDGNNVNLNAETMTLAETELRYQAVIGAVNAKFQVLKNAIGG